MPSSIASPVLDRPRKPRAARFASLERKSEVDRKNFAAREIAALVAAIVRHSTLTAQDFSGKLGHADTTQLSRWMNGLENGSALAKIWSVVELRPAFMKGAAERANHPDVKARLLVEIA